MSVSYVCLLRHECAQFVDVSGHFYQKLLSNVVHMWTIVFFSFMLYATKSSTHSSVLLYAWTNSLNHHLFDDKNDSYKL